MKVVTLDLLTGILLLYIPMTCLGVCIPDCQNGGTCVGDVCQCTAHWTGPYCADAVCEDDEIRCSDGTCGKECDGTSQCPSGEDEADCISGCKCAIERADRKNCPAAKKGITKKQCLDENCCWEKVRGNFFCYQAKNDVQKKPKNCAGTSTSSDLCGWGGVSDSVCQCLGCCPQPRIPQQPWCVKPDTTSVTMPVF